MTDEMMEHRRDSGYWQAKFEQIISALEGLKPLPSMVEKLDVTLEQVAQRVKEHDLTLYGEKMETGLVGRVERIENRVNQVWAGAALIIGSLAVWLIGQITILIHP